MTNEPVVIGGAALGVIEAGLAALVAFGVLDDPAQIAALQGLAVAVVAAVTLFVRSRVTPVAKSYRGW